MNKTVTVIGGLVLVALFTFGVLGVTNSVHEAAKFVYAALIAATSAGLTGLLMRRTN